MKESRFMLNNRSEKSHIQLAKFEELYKRNKDGKNISGLSELELERLRNDLENDRLQHSNDMVIEMIIDKVKMDTGNLINKEILDNIHIGNITDDESIIAKAYCKYSDDSCYIEFGSRIEERITLLSDLFALQFLKNEPLSESEYLILDGLHKANIERYMSNSKISEDYSNINTMMLIHEQLGFGKNFIENYVSYSMEIYEIALALLIGHEIGHHCLEHTNPSVKNEDNLKSKESDADLFGINFAMIYLKNAYPNDERKYGLHQFCGIYIPIIVSAELCNNIFEDGKCHLSIVRRIGIINDTLKQMLKSESFESVSEYIFQLLDNIQFERHIKENH